MTLLELVAAMTVISVVAAVLLPVINGAADGYASAVSTRRAVEAVAFATDRAVRLLRETPEGATPGTVGIASSSADAVRFTDGRGLRRVGDTLEVLDETGAAAVLCRGVSAFEIGYFGDNGTTPTMGTPTATQRYTVRLAASGAELRAVAFIRVRTVTP